ncbi:SLBB domain-containing protein [Akkermansiaceae bacterium]|nr:SLBB domain-containing protein [bacterium]MDB4391188.1 SLBB domain-containing protein [Akkermansiaceae bacterium]MDB4551303.1 SLBB domain-containing protein [Akkermansiaceae bacterium]MDB4665753.1 SLBB domain-containing protein [bacterium]
MSNFFSSLSISFGLLFASSAFLVAQDVDVANTAGANLREAYVLRPNDVVELSVYEEPDLAKIATILKTGEASFPLIGAVNLKGLSLGKASEKIRALYAADYIRYPRVNLSVSEYAVDYVNVIGMVTTPGKIPIPQFSDLDLRAAVANAGGLTPLADRDKIVYNPIDGEAREFSYDFIRQKGDTVILKSGDQVVVRESPFAGKTVLVSGEVIKPGTVSIPADGNLELASALAQAGGLGAEADPTAIQLTRAEGGTSSYTYESVEKGDAGKIRLRGGDRLNIPKSRFVNAVVSVIGQVNKPGVVKFPLDGKLDVFRALAMAGGTTELANEKKIILSRPGEDPKTLNLIKLRENKNQPLWLFPSDEIKVTERWF